MSMWKRSVGRLWVVIASVVALIALGCDAWQEPVGPEVPTTSAVSADFARVGRVRVTVCHRTAMGEFNPIMVADRAVPAHLGHGDALVGDPVPGEAGTEFDADCTPVLTRQVRTTQGSWDGTTFSLGATFTVSSEGLVNATATVTGADAAWPLRLVLLGYQAGAPNPPGNCSTAWLSEPLPPGPDSYPPTVSAEWQAVPAGTYCLNVASAVPVPPYPAPYSWTVTISYP